MARDVLLQAPPGFWRLLGFDTEGTERADGGVLKAVEGGDTRQTAAVQQAQPLHNTTAAVAEESPGTCAAHWCRWSNFSVVLGPVVQRVDNFIQRINPYSADKIRAFLILI